LDEQEQWTPEMKGGERGDWRTGLKSGRLRRTAPLRRRRRPETEEGGEGRKFAFSDNKSEIIDFFLDFGRKWNEDVDDDDDEKKKEKRDF